MAESWDPAELPGTGCLVAAAKKHVCGRTVSESFHGDMPSGGDKARGTSPFALSHLQRPPPSKGESQRDSGLSDHTHAHSSHLTTSLRPQSRSRGRGPVIMPRSGRCFEI